MANGKVGLAISAASLLGLATAVGGVLVGSVGVARAQCQLTQMDKLLPDDGESEDHFCKSVAISGDTAVIGAPDDDDNGTDSGSAYVFVFNGSSWVQQAKLLVADGEELDSFGYSVGISGNTIVVGAKGDEDNGLSSGSAYVFVFDGAAWVQQAKLTPDDGADGDWFGASVDISGDTVLIGARFDDDNGENSGSAYVFVFDPDGLGSWVQQAKLLPDDGAALAYFAHSVSISGNSAVIGTYGDQENGVLSGAAYVFVFDDSSWVQQAKLLADDGMLLDLFGVSVAIDGNTVVVGAYDDEIFLNRPGSAYVFVDSHGTGVWVQQAKLTAIDLDKVRDFGYSVAISGDTVVIGSRGDVVNGSPSGSAYVFVFNGSSWEPLAMLLPDDGAALDEFGWSAAISGDIALVGAYEDDDNGVDSGSVYAFDLSDDNGNGIPDECDPCEGDANRDGLVDPLDAGYVAARFGCEVGAGHPACDAADVNGDGQVNPLDSGFVLARFGPCR